MKARMANFMFGAALLIVALATAPTCRSCEHRSATSAQTQTSNART